MHPGEDTTPRRDDDLAMLKSVMHATGLPAATVDSFLMADADLDDLCDCVLAELAVPTSTASPRKP